MIIFIFLLSQPPSTYGGFKWSHYGIFYFFLNFFAIFFEFSITRRVGTEQNDNFYFLFFSAFSNLFWHELRSEERRVETDRNVNFYFHPFSVFSNLFWLQKKPQWYFLIF